LNYNKKGQPYEIIDRFRLHRGNKEIEFCRVKFARTKHEQIVEFSTIKNGDFEDESLAKKEDKKIENNTVKEDDQNKAIALGISPEGEEVQIFDIDKFAKENKLNADAIRKCIEGSQATHKQWRFKKL